MGQQLPSWGFILTVGAVIGSVMGLVYWLIARPDRKPRGYAEEALRIFG